MAFHTAAASPNRTVPMPNNFAASETGWNIDVSRSASDRIAIGEATTAAAGTPGDAAGTIAVRRACVETGVDSTDSAYPTGTTSAATSAANINTRYRFRFTRSLEPQPGICSVQRRQVDRLLRFASVQAMCHGAETTKDARQGAISRARAERGRKSFLKL